MKKKILIVIIIIIIVLLFLFLFMKSKKKLPEGEIIQSELSIIDQKYKAEIKKAFEKVELDYKSAKSVYDKYKRKDFYNSQRINDNLSNFSVDFVNLEDIDLTKVYDLEENKIENLDLKNLEKFKKIDENLDKLDIAQNFENGKYYLLRVESYLENINLYYLVQFDDNGVRNMDLIFYTEGEIIYDELNVYHIL